MRGLKMTDYDAVYDSPSHYPFSVVPVDSTESSTPAFDENPSLSDLTNGEIQTEVDLSDEPTCRASLMNVTPTESNYIHCKFPDLEFIHVLYNGHLGRDNQDRIWTWNEDGVSLW